MFYKIIHKIFNISLPVCISQIDFQREAILNMYRQPAVYTFPYKFNFYPFTIKHWNDLPLHNVDSNSLRS